MIHQASKDLAEERGAFIDAEEFGHKERFSNKTAIAPTASIDQLFVVEHPQEFVVYSYTHKTLSGSYTVLETNI